MTKEEFLTLALEKFEKLQKINQINDFYHYEKEFESIWNEFGRQSLEKNISDPPKNHQKKTLYEPDMEK